jgi:hypothetical protein
MTFLRSPVLAIFAIVVISLVADVSLAQRAERGSALRDP